MKRHYKAYAKPELAESTEKEIFEGAKKVFDEFGLRSVYTYRGLYAIKIFGKLIFYRIEKLKNEYRVEFAYICKQNHNLGIWLHLPRQQEV